MPVIEASVRETGAYWTVVEKLIVNGHTQTTTHQFPKLADGYVLIRICPRSQKSPHAVKIRNARLCEDAGKVFVESTNDNPSFKMELNEFCRSRYTFWVSKGEGEFVEE